MNLYIQPYKIFIFYILNMYCKATGKILSFFIYKNEYTN
jgi:hypothetical protein